MGHFMPCGEQIVGDFRYGISYNGVACTVFDFFLPASQVLCWRVRLGRIMEILFFRRKSPLKKNRLMSRGTKKNSLNNTRVKFHTGRTVGCLEKFHLHFSKLIFWVQDLKPTLALLYHLSLDLNKLQSKSFNTAFVITIYNLSLHSLRTLGNSNLYRAELHI